MALHFISINVRRIATNLCCYEYTWHYILFPYISVGLQRNYIIAGIRGITLYFHTCQTDCNEIILLGVVVVLYFISLHFWWIATKLYYYE